jgi:hypothetical protein
VVRTDRANGAFCFSKALSQSKSEGLAMGQQTEASGTRSITLSDAQTAVLLELLEHSLGETRAEVHHTHTPAFRDQVQKREAILRQLIEKLHEARA